MSLVVRMHDDTRVVVWLEADPGSDPGALARYVDVIVSTRPGARMRRPDGRPITSFLDLGSESDPARIDLAIDEARTVEGVVLPAIDGIGDLADAVHRRRWQLAVDVHGVGDLLRAVLVRADVVIAQSVEIGRELAGMTGGRRPWLVVRASNATEMGPALALGPWGVSTNADVLAGILQQVDPGAPRRDSATGRRRSPDVARSLGRDNVSRPSLMLMTTRDTRRLEERHGDV